MSYTYSLPTSVSFTGEGLLGYSFGPLSQNLNIYYIKSEKGHDTFMVSRKIVRTYYVLSGSGYFTIDSKRYPVSDGILIEVPPKVEYSYSGTMILLGISIPGWFAGNDRHTKRNPDVFGDDSPCAPYAQSWWTQVICARIFGKSPINAYLRLNQWLWKRAPASILRLNVMCSYGNALRRLARLNGCHEETFNTLP
jgi:hypothetical protein